MAFLLKTLAVGTFLLSSVSHASEPKEYVDSDQFAKNLNWTFNVDFEQYDAPDCSGTLIGERTYIEQNECYTWVGSDSLQRMFVLRKPRCQLRALVVLN